MAINNENWDKSVSQAEQENQAGNNSYIMAIYKRMEGLKSYTDEEMDLFKTKTIKQGSKRVYAEGKSAGKEVGTIKGKGKAEDPAPSRQAKAQASAPKGQVKPQGQPTNQQNTGAEPPVVQSKEELQAVADNKKANPNDRLKAQAEVSMKEKAKEVMDILEQQGLDPKDESVVNEVLGKLKEKTGNINAGEVAEEVKKNHSTAKQEFSDKSMKGIVKQVTESIMEKIKQLYTNPANMPQGLAQEGKQVAGQVEANSDKKNQSNKNKANMKIDLDKKEKTDQPEKKKEKIKKSFSLKGLNKSEGLNKIIEYVELNSEMFNENIHTEINFIKHFPDNPPIHSVQCLYAKLNKSIQEARNEETTDIETEEIEEQYLKAQNEISDEDYIKSFSIIME